MADTTPAANNKAVTFRGRPEREMSNVTKPPAAGTPIAKIKSAGKKLAPGVRKNAQRAMKRGMISEKAAKRHLSDT